MKELSIFIDESGDFGDYSPHSPYYIITMVFHDQNKDIRPAISRLNQELSYLGLDNLCIHTGPIIRKEEIYTEMKIDERRRIFNKMVASAKAASNTNVSILKNVISVILLKLPANSQSKFLNSFGITTKSFFLLMM